MIHGFPTTPQIYQYSAKVFSQNGYDVYAPLIPSFRTDYHEFYKTNFTAWFDYIDNYYLKLREQYPYLSVLGVSMGGAMTLKLGEIHNILNKPDCLISISAPVIFNSFKYKTFTYPSAYLARLVAPFLPYINPRNTSYNPKRDDGAEEWTGYKGVYLNQSLSLIWNLKFIYKDLPKISEPIFLMHDKNDKTVPFKNLEIISKGIASVNKCVNIVEMKGGKHTHHSLLMYRSVQEDYTKRILNFMEACYDHKTN